MRVFLLVLAFWAAGFGLRAEPVPVPDIQSVIDAQFDAFAKGDLERAYGYASPMIQSYFPSAQIFGRLVQDKYPVIWTARKVTYLGVRQDGARMIERVQVIGADGALGLFDYEMIEVDGAWRINGVWPVKADSVGV